jgi:hypothetical protein
MEIFLTILAVLGGLLILIIILGYSEVKNEKKVETQKKEAKARKKKRQELRPIIIEKFNEVINKDSETRRKAIDEIAETLGISYRAVMVILTHEGINWGKTDEEREAEEQQAKRKREEKRLAKYIAGEYNKVIDKPEKIREKRIKQIATDMDKSTAYIVKILRKKKCMDIPEI